MASGPQIALQEFIVEAEELIEQVSMSLAAVEKRQHNQDTLKAIYRDIHTLKGSAQLFGCRQMAQIAHSIESSIDPVRQELINLEPDLLDVIYSGIDVIKTIVSGLKQNKDELDVSSDMQRIIPKLTAVVTRLMGGDILTLKDAPLIVTEPQKLAAVKSTPVPASSGEGWAIFDDPVATTSAVATPMPATLSVAPALKQVTSTDAPSTPAAPTATTTAEMSQLTRKTEDKNQADAKDTKNSNGEPGGETIRVQVSLLTNLMNLVGELVLIRNQVVQHAGQSKDPNLLNFSQRLSIVTSEIQNEVMKTRMQPIGNILTKFHRVIRDVSRDLGKNIELSLSGTETELDKTLIEAVKDPLTHIVRNSIDHGLETIAERKASSKAETGKISICSYHEGGQVIIEVADDGRGISRQRVGKKAVDKGLITAEQLDRMTDREVQALVFAPGFSTAEAVSNISGRGVGMDVVKTNIEKIGGVVELQSIEGEGTTIRLKIPLTLAIIPALIVKAGGERFAIPQVKLVELVRVEHDQQKDSHVRIDQLQGKPVFRLRGDLLPLVSLAETLNTPSLADPEVTSIAVLNADQGQFGLIVDQIVDSTDIVVKPLANFMKNLSLYSGATVMGDGYTALTLDVVGLANHLKLFDQLQSQTRAEQKVIQHVEDESADYIILDIGAKNDYAIPLCLVNRLEEFKKSAIEYSGSRRVVRYRDSILPLISVIDHLKITDNDSKNEGEDTFPVVVIERNDRFFGLEVRAIKDVQSIASIIDADLKDRNGVLGTMIHGNGVVVVLNVHEILEAVAGRAAVVKDPRKIPAKDPIAPVALAAVTEAEETQETAKTSVTAIRGVANISNDRSQHTILLAEDNAFYRKHVTQVLKEAGYKVATENDGAEAFKRLSGSKEGEFSLILSDIEMPNMDGYVFASSVRREPRFGNLPIVALTTRFSRSSQEKGYRSGFTSYLEKLNPVTLLQELDNLLSIKAG